MKTILIIDDVPAISEPIAVALEIHGYQTMRAENGADALRTMTTGMPDLILLDMAMPVLDGLAFLAALRQMQRGAAIPVIILASQADRSQVMAAAALGISGYLLKSRFSLAELLQLISKTLGQNTEPAEPERPAVEGQPRIEPPKPATLPEEALRSLKPVITRSEIADMLDHCGELQGFSPAVTEVIKLSGNQRCSIEQVSKAISRDHAIALKILKLANSAVYTRGEPVDSVHKAVMRIGLGQIRQAVLNIGVIEKFSAGTLHKFIDAGQFWEHSIATGLISAEIAHSRNEKEADTAFTTGLLHDIGRIVFATHFGELYQRVLAAAQDLQLPLEQVEHRMLCNTHADIMDRVFRSWKFAKEFINPIVFHHVSAGNIRKAAPQETMQIATLGLANRLAHAMMLGSSGNQTIYPTEDLCELMRLDPQVIARVEATAREETDKVKFALLANSSQPNWPQLREVHRGSLSAPLFPLYCSSAPAIDAHRIFCAELCTNSLDEADQSSARFNIGVISFRSPRERLPVSQSYRALEAEHGVAMLPLLVISPGGRVMPEQSLMEGRRVECISTPMPVSRFIAAVNRLLESQALATAA